MRDCQELVLFRAVHAPAEEETMHYAGEAREGVVAATVIWVGLVRVSGELKRERDTYSSLRGIRGRNRVPFLRGGVSVVV